MNGTIRWNFLFGLAGGVIVMFLSLTNNVWLTALTRSLYAFIIFFLLAFVIRWWLGTLEAATGEKKEHESEITVGSQIDLQTPDDEDPLLPPSDKVNEQAGEDGVGDSFQPLNPPKLVTKTEHTPEQMADALRRMSEE